MYLSPETLIDGCMETLREDVLPGVASRFARGQLWAVLDVLQNLRDRVEEKAALHQAETESAARALEGMAAALAEAGAEEAARKAAAAAAEAPDAPAARSAALRAALVEAIDALHGASGEMNAAGRAALGEHLATQVLRDISVLKPSLLNEISKG